MFEIILWLKARVLRLMGKDRAQCVLSNAIEFYELALNFIEISFGWGRFGGGFFHKPWSSISCLKQ